MWYAEQEIARVRSVGAKQDLLARRARIACEGSGSVGLVRGGSVCRAGVAHAEQEIAHRGQWVRSVSRSVCGSYEEKWIAHS